MRRPARSRAVADALLVRREGGGRIGQLGGAGLLEVRAGAEGQRHGVCLARVATPADLLESPQLAARGFFRDVEVAGRRVTVPGPPHRFAGLDVGPRSSPG